MKKILNIRLLGLLISSLVLSSSSCKKDDERPASASNNNSGNNYQAVTGLEEGSITAEVNGKQINYTNVRYRLDKINDEVDVYGDDFSEENTRVRLTVTVPDIPTQGKHSISYVRDNDFYISYAVFADSSNLGKVINKNVVGEVDVVVYDQISTITDSITTYRVEGYFSYSGERHDNTIDSVDIQNGKFHFIYEKPHN